MNRPLDPEKLEVYQTSLNSSYRLHEGILGIEDQAPITITITITTTKGGHTGKM